MAEVIKNILSGRMLTNDLIQWLKSNNTDVSELKSEKISEFIPYFISYTKEQCSWLLPRNEKGSETILEDRANTGTVPTNDQSHLQIVGASQKAVKKNNPRVDTFPPENVIYGSENKSNSRHQSGKKVQVLTFGCTPYYQKRREVKVNTQKSKLALLNVPPDFNNLNAFPSVGCNINKADLNSFDAFPPLGCKVIDVKSKRRITPTPVQATSNSSSKFGKPHFALPSNKIQSEVFKASFQDGSSDFQHERDMLKQTRDRLAKPSVIPNAGPESKVFDNKPCQVISSDDYLFPDPENIDMFPEISFFVEVYSYLLTNALVPNVTAELYFVLELITSKVTKNDQPVGNDVFCFIHNCIYFAVSVLSQQSHLLHMLDKATLGLLKDIPYLMKFSPQLVDILQLHCTVKEDSAVSLPSLTRVPFQLDDDSRINFTDESSFISFKKQRDLFYGLLREWQDQPLEYLGTRNQETFTRKVKQLISLGPNSLNLYHLARLFQSQLIASCMCLEVNEVYDELLSDIQKNFPTKFKKLQERFFTPSSVGGLDPPPTFYGIQAFFSELIVSAASPCLNQHLLNIFVSKILELNDTDIFSDQELNSLGTVKDKYIFLLHTLRLLGKFLGYIHFLPYKQGEPITLNVTNHYLESRKHAIPPLDLKHLLKKAVHNHHIILTVPWVVEYLSMMDPLAQNLQYIGETLHMLTDIYRWKSFPSNDVQCMLFLQLLIGWLFAVLQYPKKYCTLLQPISFEYSPINVNKGLDMLPVINKQLIHSCCPFLIRFKVLVFDFMKDIIKDKREVRKITPLSTSQTFNTSTPAQKVESLLEENFFFLHPSSLKKTSDFVSERMASKTISKIRSEVTTLKLSFVQDIVNSEQYKSMCALKEKSTQQMQIIALIDSSILGMYDNLHYKVRTLMEDIFEEVNKILPVLLSDDTKQPVIDMCTIISFKNAVNKVTEWCDSNLLLDAIKSDIKSKLQHLSKGQRDIVPDKNLNISHWISRFRNTILKILSKSEDVTSETIINLCSKMLELMAEDCVRSVKRVITLLSVDMFITLIAHFPEKYETVDEVFIQLWSKCPKDLISARLFVCAQNIKFLLASQNFELSCERYVKVVKYLLNVNIFTTKELQKCLNDINTLNWQDYTLQRTVESFIEILTS